MDFNTRAPRLSAAISQPAPNGNVETQIFYALQNDLMPVMRRAVYALAHARQELTPGQDINLAIVINGKVYEAEEIVEKRA